MPYPPRIGVARDAQVVFRLAPREVELVNQARNGKSRSDYLRGLIQKDLEERGLK
jgi:hypothetical protein